MPPRYAYWTILVDGRPTAFRAREREELLPTLNQLKRKSPDAAMKWFGGGRLWQSPEEAEAARRRPKAPREPRGRDWRPGGNHRDPRDRFKKGAQPRHAAAATHRERPKPFTRSEPKPRKTEAPGRRDESPARPPAPEQIVIKPKPPERG